MKNKPVQSLEQGAAQAKCEFKNLEIVNINSASSKTSTKRISNNENEVIDNESLNLPENLPATFSLDKVNSFSILSTNKDLIDVAVVKGDQKNISGPSDILRLFIKYGEFVYAHPRDIIMIESCDHLVKVYMMSGDKVKKAIRNNTLKDFLSHLPPDQFMRIGRFCAINLCRLSGGSFNDQTFEFDFRISIKLKHAISHTAFNAIGK